MEIGWWLERADFYDTEWFPGQLTQDRTTVGWLGTAHVTVDDLYHILLLRTHEYTLKVVFFVATTA